MCNWASGVDEEKKEVASSLLTAGPPRATTTQTGANSMTRTLLLTLTLLAIGCLTAAPAMAQFGQGNSSNNLFQQYDIAGVGAYPAPHYSPQLGAQSYYTYQPLYPHELTYQHNRNYFNYYNLSLIHI